MCSMIQNQNSYPMKDWHLENMKKTAVKYVTGLSENASSYQKRQYKKYGGNLFNVRRNIDFDIRHGVAKEEVLTFLAKVRNDSEFSSIREKEGSMERLNEIEKHYIPAAITTSVPFAL
jgi:hypothetical protein